MPGGELTKSLAPVKTKKQEYLKRFPAFLFTQKIFSVFLPNRRVSKQNQKNNLTEKNKMREKSGKSGSETEAAFALSIFLTNLLILIVLGATVWMIYRTAGENREFQYFLSGRFPA